MEDYTLTHTQTILEVSGVEDYSPTHRILEVPGVEDYMIFEVSE